MKIAPIFWIVLKISMLTEDLSRVSQLVRQGLENFV